MDSLPPERLSWLLDAPAHKWSARDGAAALRHQLAAPLLPDLTAALGAAIERVERLAAEPGAPRSFAELFTCPSPARELLEAAKAWAREVRNDAASPLCGAPATVLYYAAIAAVLVHCGEKITRLSVAELQEGFAWSGRQSGAEGLRELFNSALERMPP